ncbi:serine/threonine-protein kinase [Hyalangium sp.]|uniref:serine/threonine-protein kinase n=1 Tax=Hyalangium sp. TaxID=2028555 RepID=UPI00389A1344
MPAFPPRIGAWRLLELRSWGSYGTVYRAEPLERPGTSPFALKLAHSPMDPRFLREAELLRRVRHPHVPRLYDSGLWENSSGTFPFLVMQWAEGVPLYDWARGRVVSSRQVMRVVAHIAWALAATHAAEAVHRDVKGDNIMVRPEDAHPMLLDFGAGDFRGAPTLTEGALPPGTYGYRSPEALRFQQRFWRTPGARYEPGPADDLYALGITAYRLVTGAFPPPWEPSEIREQEPSLPTVASEPAEKRVNLSPELAAIIRQLLSEEPLARGSAAQVAEALEQAAKTAGPEADQPITHRARVAPAMRRSEPRSTRLAWVRKPWVSAAMGLAATAGLATVWVVHEPRNPERQAPPWPPEESARPKQDKDSADGGTSLADETLASMVKMEQPQLTWQGLEADMPKEPLPGQARPPCKQRGAVVINGGCWGRPENSTPPCGEGDYEWGGLCYRPILGKAAPATSEPR